MAKREVATLNEDESKLQVPQTGDTYTLPRDTEITGNLAVTISIEVPKITALGGGVTIEGPVLADNTDNTKTTLLDLSGITTATQRTITVPDEDITLGTGWLVSDDTNANYGHGLNALDSTITGATNNIAIGENAGTAITTGDNNIAIGTNAGDGISTETGNVAIGSYALSDANPGISNVAIGEYALFVAAGNYNVAIGLRAGEDIDAGASNTTIGNKAGSSIDSGSYNIAIGDNANPADSGNQNIAIGRSVAVADVNDDNQIAIGNYVRIAPPIIDGYMGAITDVDYSAKKLTITGTSAYASAVTNLDAGDLILQGGTAATTGIGVGGDIIIRGGLKGSTGTTGAVKIAEATTEKVGFFGATPVTQQTALTTEDASTVDSTYGTEESDVINNLRTRVGELETILQNLGLLA